MKIIKLDAIDSTNSFLKELAQNSTLENYTTVITDKQVSGRGQMQNSWHSKPFKNLTFSTFKGFKNLQIQHQSYLNFCISIAVFNVLKKLSVPRLAIKWPNDIMSGDKKVCGILIETTFTKTKIKNAIIGIGLNVNQEEFPVSLTHASSLKKVLKKEFDLDNVLQRIIDEMKVQIHALEHFHFEKIHQEYEDNLYRKDTASTFTKEGSDSLFMGIISGVTSNGDLEVLLEDDSIESFAAKSISFARL